MQKRGTNMNLDCKSPQSKGNVMQASCTTMQSLAVRGKVSADLVMKTAMSEASLLLLHNLQPITCANKLHHHA